MKTAWILAALALCGCCLGTANLEQDVGGNFLITQTDGAEITGIVVTLHPYPTTLWHVRGILNAPGDGLARRTPLTLGVVPAGMRQHSLFNPDPAPGRPVIEDGEEIVVDFEGVGERGYGYYTATNTPKRYRQEMGRLVEIPYVRRWDEEILFSSRDERLRALREIEEEIAGGFSAFLRIARDPDATPDQKRTVAWLIQQAGTRDIVEAYRDLRTRKTLSHYGYEADETKKINDLHPLADLKNLRTLVLGRQRVTDLSPVAALMNLEHLEVGGNRIESLAPLAGMSKLKYLNIGGNRIVDLSPLSTCGALERLWADDNRISDLAPLRSSNALRHLSLKRNRITGIKPLDTLPVLFHLDLEGNQIAELGTLNGMAELSVLNLTDNRIDDATPLAELFCRRPGWYVGSRKHLGTPGHGLYIYLEGNPIRDESPILRMRDAGANVDD